MENNPQGGLNAEQRLILLLSALATISIFGLVLLMALWAYKEIVALSLFGLFVLAVGVYLRGKWNEQNLRLIRYKQNEETPLIVPQQYPHQIQQGAQPYYIPPNQYPMPAAYHDQRPEVKF